MTLRLGCHAQLPLNIIPRDGYVLKGKKQFFFLSLIEKEVMAYVSLFCSFIFRHRRMCCFSLTATRRKSALTCYFFFPRLGKSRMPSIHHLNKRKVLFFVPVCDSVSLELFRRCENTFGWSRGLTAQSATSLCLFVLLFCFLLTPRFPLFFSCVASPSFALPLCFSLSPSVFLRIAMPFQTKLK